ncbi:hypothetical protein OAD30_04120 [Alphaproteobacteria bacterium]|nr:hypothetical protein [Alphaproteobacteria bacterium]
MKLLITILTFMFISFGIKAHSLNGKYECRFNSWSPFKTEVVVKNFTKKLSKYGDVDDYTEEVYIDGKKLDGGRGRHFIRYDNKKRITIDVMHLKYITFYNVEGVKYNVFENTFSEEKGSEWNRTKSVFCEKQ